MGRLPLLFLTSFERVGIAGYQSLTRVHIAYCDMATDRQQRSCDVVCEHHVLTISRVEHRNSALSDALRTVPNFVVGGWARMYNTAATLLQGVKADTDAKVLKAEFSLNWTGTYNDHAVSPAPSADTPNGSSPGAKLLYLDLHSDMPGSDVRMLTGASRYNAASPAPTLATGATSRN